MKNVFDNLCSLVIALNMSEGFELLFVCCYFSSKHKEPSDANHFHLTKNKMKYKTIEVSLSSSLYAANMHQLN